MKRAIILIALAFFITLGTIIGSRMETDALAVVVGMGASIVVSVPAAVLLLLALSRREQHPAIQNYEGSSPPVVVIQSGQAPTLPAPPAIPSSAIPRSGTALEASYRVLGDE